MFGMVACQHLVPPPTDSSRAAQDEPKFPVNRETVILIVNGYSAERPQWFRSEGADQLGADLWRWSEHVVAALSEKLQADGAQVYTAETSEWMSFESSATLVVEVTSLTPPRSSAGEPGATIAVEFSSGDGSWQQTIDSRGPAHRFTEALAQLRLAMLTDDSLRKWLASLPH